MGPGRIRVAYGSNLGCHIQFCFMGWVDLVCRQLLLQPCRNLGLFFRALFKLISQTNLKIQKLKWNLGCKESKYTEVELIGKCLQTHRSFARKLWSPQVISAFKHHQSSKNYPNCYPKHDLRSSRWFSWLTFVENGENLPEEVLYNDRTPMQRGIKRKRKILSTYGGFSWQRTMVTGM